MRTIIAISLIAACSCLGFAVYEYVFESPAMPPPECEISHTDFDAGIVLIGTYKFQTTISNPSREPRRIIGFVDECKPTCCFSHLQDAPILIPPAGSIVIDCELLVKTSGSIDAEIKIYLEENGIRTVTLRVTGTAVEAPRAPK